MYVICLSQENYLIIAPQRNITPLKAIPLPYHNGWAKEIINH